MLSWLWTKVAPLIFSEGAVGYALGLGSFFTAVADYKISQYVAGGAISKATSWVASWFAGTGGRMEGLMVRLGWAAPKVGWLEAAAVWLKGLAPWQLGALALAAAALGTFMGARMRGSAADGEFMHKARQSRQEYESIGRERRKLQRVTRKRVERCGKVMVDNSGKVKVGLGRLKLVREGVRNLRRLSIWEQLKLANQQDLLAAGLELEVGEGLKQPMSETLQELQGWGTLKEEVLRLEAKEGAPQANSSGKRSGQMQGGQVENTLEDQETVATISSKSKVRV